VFIELIQDFGAADLLALLFGSLGSDVHRLGSAFGLHVGDPRQYRHHKLAFPAGPIR
jgi:hypothetical protein